jgi:SAM-dependent methyltransferase
MGVALSDIEQAMPRFADWVYGGLRDDLGHRVLDAGAGIGTYVGLLLADGREVVALEYNPPFVSELERRHGGDSRVTVFQGELGGPDGLPAFDPVDSAICLNVLEHVEDDGQALRNLLARVKPGGNLVLLVPAYPRLYNTIDEAIGHYRRYSTEGLTTLLSSAGWNIERMFRLNAFGVPGWFVAGLLRRKTPGRDLTRIYDWLIPAFAATEKYVIRGLWGLSLVAVCRRPAEARD